MNSNSSSDLNLIDVRIFAKDIITKFNNNPDDELSKNEVILLIEYVKAIDEDLCNGKTFIPKDWQRGLLKYIKRNNNYFISKLKIMILKSIFTYD
jgi:hypothetical protein